MAKEPTGIHGPDVRRALVGLRAWGEIMGVPPAQLDAILDRAKDELETQDQAGPPGPPGPP